MKKAFKIIGKVLLGLLILLAVFLIVMTIYNQIMLKKNKDLYDTPLGQLVEVDGHNMSIYTEGEGEHTIVFLSGWGTSSPILDFKPLYTRLSDENKIVVVEKFGYGFSDIVDSERDFDTILRQDREALQKAGVEAPYILCPHSMSGIEAILWAQKYPDEVEAIVGLDMSTPKAYTEENLSNDDTGLETAMRLFRDSGLIRLVFTDNLISDSYSDHEKDILKALTFKNYFNKTVANEGNHIADAIDEINSAPKPDVPTLLFLSDGEQAGGQLWIDAMHDYADGLTDAKVIELNCGHMVAEEEPDTIEKEMNSFIDTLN